MSDRIAAVEAYQNGIVKGDDDGVAGYLADDVVVETNFGRAEGVAAALTLLHEPRMAGLLAAGPQWSAPAERGDMVTVTAQLPPTAPFSGVEFVFTFGGQKITRVEQQTLPAGPLAPAELRLTDEIKSAVDGALDNQTPMVIAYSDPGTRAVIFGRSHPREQQMDFRRRGVAIVVDLDRLEGRGPSGRLLMLRG